MKPIENLIIIGGGPAGLTAAIYSARAQLNPLLFEGFMAGGMPPGGQLTTTTEVENFPGFPEWISGLELMKKMKEQSKKYWTRIEMKTVDRVDLSKQPFEVVVGEDIFLTRSIVIATGASAKRLRVLGEDKFWQRGISTCAICDGGLPIFRDQHIVVVGGGDAAIEEAIFMNKFASKVSLIVRRDTLKASKAMQKKLEKYEDIQILWNSEVVECLGDTTLSGVKIKNNQTYEESILECKGLFYAIGHHPNTEFLQGQLATDEDGYLITEPGTGKTNIPWVFAAGDVQDKVYKQAITSAGSGCIVALEVEKFLEGIE